MRQTRELRIVLAAIVLLLLPLSVAPSLNGVTVSPQPPTNRNSSPTIAPLSSTSGSVSEWNQFHGDSSHDGFSSSLGPLSNETSWTTQIGGASDGLIISDHMIISSSFRQNIFDNIPSIFALSESNGSILFDYSTPTVCDYSACSIGVSGTTYPAAGNGLVFFEDYAEAGSGFFCCNSFI
jgi:hypothetical protein